MPYRKRVAHTVQETHPWIAEVVGSDECLLRILNEAAVAGYYAGSEIEAARRHASERGLKQALASFGLAQKIMARFEDGRFEPGWRAWKSAIDAVRKFVDAQHEAVEAVVRARTGRRPVRDDQNRVVGGSRAATRQGRRR